MATRIYINKMIRKYGQTVQHMRKTTIDKGDGLVEIEYVSQEPKRGNFAQLTGFDTIWDRLGYRIEADYIGTFLPDTDLQEEDRLYIDDHWYEIDTIIPRKTGEIIDYLETLLRRIKT